MDVKIGEVFRDTYDLGGGRKNLRTIRVIEVLPNGVRAEVVTDVGGKPPTKPRTTTLMLKTLRAGYEPALPTKI